MRTPADSGTRDAGLAARPPAVAGRFYPAEPGRLRRAIDALLTHARTVSASGIAGLIAPHAGHLYAGQIAADALTGLATARPDLVVILCPNHTRPRVHDFALFPGAAFRTPLGETAVDRPLTAALIDAAADAGTDAVADADPHRDEHAIEVLLPFVQTLAPHARLVAIVVSTHEPGALARFAGVLARQVAPRRAVLVASSDLSHYPTADGAVGVDRETLEAIVRFDAEALLARERRVVDADMPGLVTTACGLGPVTVVMHAARLLGAHHASLISYANSADCAAGDPFRVVGYGAVTFQRDGPSHTRWPEPAWGPRDEADAVPPPLTAAERGALLRLARDTFTRYLRSDTLPLARGLPPALYMRRQGVFVTLRAHGDLRGCIGHIVADAPLPQLVSRMAFAAAFRDTRFPPLTEGELAHVHVEISVLSEPRTIARPEDITVGRDGVILQAQGRSAVFLPQVAPSRGWSREQMLDALCRKAGLAAGCWRSGATLSTFQAESFEEGDGVPA